MNKLGVAIKLANLTKQFGDITALDNVSFEVDEGEVFGYLGPNGAGKSTTIRLLSTLLTPTKGTASILGLDIHDEPEEIRRRIGVLPEEAAHTHYKSISVYENLKFFARLYGLSNEEADDRIGYLLDFLELTEHEDDTVETLSTGNRQKLALARALIHKPEVVFLDEPTASLDPIMAKKVRNLILDLSEKEHLTFFISSHNLPEVQRICSSIAILNKGHILKMGKIDEIKMSLTSMIRYSIRLQNKASDFINTLKKFDFVENPQIVHGVIILDIRNPDDNNPILIDALVKKGAKIIEVREEEISLEDLYIKTLEGVA